jgi:hypothetical protein
MRLQLIAPALLLCAASGSARAAPPRPRLSVEGTLELAGYADSDHVSVLSPTVAATVADEIAGWSVSGRYLVDAVSAASVDIVATASPRWHEIRHVGSGAASYKRGPFGVTASGGFSREPDYLSFGLGAVATLDLLDKNVTPFLGVSYGHNDVGRTGLPPSQWWLMQTGGLQVGATFVVDRSTIAGVQLEGELERGFLSKPYRYVPLFAPGEGGRNVPAGASPAWVDAHRLDERPLERLPGRRDRYALSGRIARRVGRATLRLDERLYVDDWALFASTTDARALVDVGTRWLITAHLRYHTQTAARFWQRAYEVTALPTGGVAQPPYLTGDRELSWLWTVTAGAGTRVRIGSSRGTAWSLTLDVEGGYTRYPDALYITHRWSLLSSVGISANWKQ